MKVRVELSPTLWEREIFFFLPMSILLNEG